MTVSPGYPWVLQSAKQWAGPYFRDLQPCPCPTSQRKPDGTDSVGTTWYPCAAGIWGQSSQRDLSFS